MSLMKEYIDRRPSPPELESELLKLISEYNKHRDTYLFVYAAAISKPIPKVPLDQEDYYAIYDLLAPKKDINKVDIYIETPGGRGETAEEIVKFLRKNFDTVSFVVSGEAKSAGTLIVLSGDNILMTETGSLGPIDAQLRIGRSLVSAYDYIEWVEEKKDEAEKTKALNPFDAAVVAQITPGELKMVHNAYEYAKDLVKEWLVNYKFGKWDFTDTRKIPVTKEMKTQKAKEIADKLADHSKWKLHGRSIKADDLEEMGLKIIRVDEDEKLANIIYRIQTVCRWLFDSTNAFKICATEDTKIFKQAALIGQPPAIIPKGAAGPLKQVKGDPVATDFETICPKCGARHAIFAMFVKDKKLTADYKNKGYKPFPKDGKIRCTCDFEIDLLGVKNQIELGTGKPIILNLEVGNGRK
jgi:hypothetical protein